MSVRMACAAIAGLALFAGAATLAPTTAQAQKDWSTVTMTTAEGGMAIGNPEAKVKLVEYGSLTCNHCAHFARDSKGTLIEQYVRSGQVQFEYRNFVLNAVDAVASVVARCGGADNFFPIADEMYATQSQWIAKIQGLSDARKQEIASMPQTGQFAAIAGDAGFNELAAKHGVTKAESAQCLANSANAQRLVEMHNKARTLGVSGTPTFSINGTMANVNTWAAIEPELKKALVR